MHMADALISPAVGGAMLAVTAGLAVYSASKVKEEMDEKKIPLMGVMGAFVFAAQMINFTIPATGSSGIGVVSSWPFSWAPTRAS